MSMLDFAPLMFCLKRSRLMPHSCREALRSRSEEGPFSGGSCPTSSTLLEKIVNGNTNTERGFAENYHMDWVAESNDVLFQLFVSIASIFISIICFHLFLMLPPLLVTQQGAHLPWHALRRWCGAYANKESASGVTWKIGCRVVCVVLSREVRVIWLWLFCLLPFHLLLLESSWQQLKINAKGYRVLLISQGGLWIPRWWEYSAGGLGTGWGGAPLVAWEKSQL